MILFVNVFVTNSRGSAGSTNRYDRLDLFKATLASYARIDRIAEAIIYAQLDGGYSEREAELRDYIRGLFPVSTYHNRSPSNQTEWQIALVESPLLTTDRPILYSGNDDHLFIDSDTDVLYEGLALMAAEPKEQINTIHISSWPEAISTVFGLRDYTKVGRYWVADMLYPDAIQIVNSAFFKHVFFDLEIDGFIRRTDPFLTNWYPYLGSYKWPSKVPHPAVKTFLPLREQFRHFDAYYHVNVPLDRCPLLELPLKPPGTVEEYNAAHRRCMITPHQRDYQRPTLCMPTVFPANYTPTPNDQELPLDEETIRAGYR